MDAALDGNIDGPQARSRVRSLAVMVAGSSTFLGLYAPQPLLGHFEHVFTASKAAVALTISAPTAAVALFAPLVGSIADRTGRRRLIVASLFALAAVTALAATAPGLEALIAWRFAEGAVIPGAYVVCLGTAGLNDSRGSQIVEPARRATRGRCDGRTARRRSGPRRRSP